MSSHPSGTGSSVTRLACALIAVCGSVAAQAQTLQIAASLLNNQSGTNNNVIYGVTATPQAGLPPTLSLAALPINPANAQNFSGFNSNGLVYAPSAQPGASVDLIGSSNGAIYRFFGPIFSGTPGGAGPNAVPIWSACAGGSGCNGPASPGAMAIDGNGTLYVLSLDAAAAGCPGPVLELWAFAKSGGSASGFAATPVLIDNNVAGPGTSSCTPRDYSNNDIDQPPNQGFLPNPYYVSDLMVAPAGVAAATPLTANDVLVVFGDASTLPVAVMADYNAANLAAVLNGTATLKTPLTVLNSSDIVHWGQAPTGAGGAWQSTGGDNAQSAAAWPADSNILLLDYDGNIFKLTWSSTTSNNVTTYSVVNQPVFWSLLPSAGSGAGVGAYQVGSLRAGVQAGGAYAFVTAYTIGEPAMGPSELLALDNSGGVNPPQTVSTADGPLGALAVSSAPSVAGTGTGTGAQCVSGCNLTGGVQQQIMGTPAAIAAVEALGANGKITENVCIVAQDPRHICNASAPPAPGNAWYNAKTLPVSAVCPNSHFNPSFGNTVIPDYLCGDYGSGGPGTGTGFAVIQGIANGVDAISGLLIYNDANADAFFDPGQTEACTGGQPITIFGWAPWSDSPVEGSIPESPNMTELTYGCGTSRANSSGMSISLVGAKLSLATASEFKPNNVSFAQFKYANLLADVLVAPIDPVQKVRLAEIIVRSELFLNQGEYACAARKVWRADQYVADHASHFHGIPSFDPNSYGRSRSRLGNLFFTIFSRIEGNPAPQTWPVPEPPGVCANRIDVDPDGY